jgi:hypothetical protein
MGLSMILYLKVPPQISALDNPSEQFGGLNQSSGAVDGTILEFGDFAYDGTTGDLTGYETDPEGGGTPSDAVTANTDALVRDAYQAALGAKKLDANADGTATDVSGYSTEGDFVKEYVDAGNIDNFGVTGQDDGLGG